jgi:hypothetical protein
MKAARPVVASYATRMVTSDLWSREAPLKGCRPYRNRSPGSSARTSSGWLARGGRPGVAGLSFVARVDRRVGWWLPLFGCAR